MGEARPWEKIAPAERICVSGRRAEDLLRICRRETSQSRGRDSQVVCIIAGKNRRPSLGRRLTLSQIPALKTRPTLVVQSQLVRCFELSVIFFFLRRKLSHHQFANQLSCRDKNCTSAQFPPSSASCWFGRGEHSRGTTQVRHGAVPCAPSGLRGGADGGRQTPAHGKGAACPDLGLGDGLSEGAAPRAEGGCAASRPEQREYRCRSNTARWPVGSAPVPQPPFAPSHLGRRASRTTRPRKSAAWRPLQRCRAAHSTDGASRRRSSRTRSPRSVPRPGVASHRLALAALAARCMPRRGGGGTPQCTPAPRPTPTRSPS